MKDMHALVGGLAGAIALNAIHELTRRFYKHAPHIHKIGEEALEKSADSLGVPDIKKSNLYEATLVGDLISNGIYYSAIGMGSRKNIWLSAVTTGLTAGLSVLKLPKLLGINDKPVTRTAQTKALSVAFYVFGALITAATIRGLDQRYPK